MQMEIVNYSLDVLPLLFFVAVTAGLLDTLAGGGGLLTVPALILTGVPPLAALGTNKMQGCIGTATASCMMFKNKKVAWGSVKHLMLSAFIGAAIGTTTVQFIRTDMLSFIIPVVLVCIATYFLISPTPAENPSNSKLKDWKYKNVIVPCIGYYDGMFGPGTGSFFALSGISCQGHNLLTSTAIAKTLNFSTNVASLTVFLIAGHIVWKIGLTMMLGQAIGAWLGSHCLFKINPTYLRGIIVVMCCGMLVKYCNSMGWFNAFL